MSIRNTDNFSGPRILTGAKRRHFLDNAVFLCYNQLIDTIKNRRCNTSDFIYAAQVAEWRFL
jgi:hypothetical protein